VPGVAPVIVNVTWRILIVAKLLWKLSAKIVDVVKAFLHGNLEEEIYIESPEGYGLNREEDCVILDKSIYSLAKTARIYFLKFMKSGSLADPQIHV
jgi:hypothetical protein